MTVFFDMLLILKSLNTTRLHPRIRVSHQNRDGQRLKKRHRLDKALQKYSSLSSAAIKNSCWTLCGIYPPHLGQRSGSTS